MRSYRIALANLPYPTSPDDAVARVQEAVGRAGAAGAGVVCVPECYVPGYRAQRWNVPPLDAGFMERAWSAVASAAAAARIAVVLGTERDSPSREGGILPTALVINADGSIAGFQDKAQIDPSEEGIYVAAPEPGRRIFRAGDLTFGIAICHEGWRYPETVRAAVRQGAQLVFHPHFHWAEGDSYRPSTFADPANTFHEKALLCRAAENTCYIASVNYATEGSPTTSAVVNPDGTLLAWQPYGQAGVLVADIDLDAATGLLASRQRT
jgi:predicted amidohydrolase